MPDICPVFDIAPSALGILVCERKVDPPFAETALIRRLIENGSFTGLPVFAFAPWTWSTADGCVSAWTWDDVNNVWSNGRRPLPRLVYDRAWPADECELSRYRRSLEKIGSARFVYLNGKLPHKGHVYATLAKDARFSEMLPPTGVYTGDGSLEAWLDRNAGSAFLKPANGSQGRRVVSYTSGPDGSVTLRGRHDDNRPFTVSFATGQEARNRLRRWIGSRTYLMQPLLDLRGADGEPFDIRALVQKNGRGRWALTGIAARCGLPGTVTANLHGGGRAKPAEQQLASLFGRESAEPLIRQLRNGCREVVRSLEQHYGRFAELGLDFGIDRTGHVWFLEANSKPGRAAMAGLGEPAEKAAVARPIAYARSILVRPHGRVIHEFDHL